MSSDDQEVLSHARPIPSLPRLRNRAPARGDRHVHALLRPARPGLRLGRARARRVTPRVDRGRARVDLALRRPAPGLGAGRRRGSRRG